MVVVLTGTRSLRTEKHRSITTRANLHVPPSPPRVSRTRRGNAIADEWEEFSTEDNVEDEGKCIDNWFTLVPPGFKHRNI